MGLLSLKDYDVNPEYLPKGVLRQAFVWLFLLIGILLMCLFWFPLQERVLGKVEIYHKGAPIQMKAKTNGQLNLFITDESVISKNQILGWYDWNVSPEEVSALESLSIYNYDKRKGSDELLELLAPLKNKGISQLQGEISAIYSTYDLYNNTVQQSTFDSYVSSQEKRIGNIEQNKSLNRSVLDRKLNQTSLIRDHIKSDSTLLEQGILSLRDFQIRRQKYLDDLIKIEEESLSLGAADETILSIQSSIELGKYNLALVSIEQYKNLITAIENFKKTYFNIKEEKAILAPISGKVSFADILNFSETVAPGDIMLTIEPSSSESKSIARIITGPRSSGRIREGNRVMIKLDAYPIEQFGVVYGTISSKKDIPEGDRYIYNLALEDGLKTTYDDYIPLQPQLTGEGTILINRTNIFEIIKNEILARRESYFALENDPVTKPEAILK